MLYGLDSAFGPTSEQAQHALSLGYQWWGWYVGGPGAYHVWTDAEVAVLAAAGYHSSLPIWVPKLDLSGDPIADTHTAASRSEALGWYGAVALDTEASMRGNPRLVPYVDGWNLAMQHRYGYSVVYGGGNYVGSAHPWWIVAGRNPTLYTCYQRGTTNIAGLDCDADVAGDSFPLCTLFSSIGDDMTPDEHQTLVNIAAQVQATNNVAQEALNRVKNIERFLNVPDGGL